MGFMSGAPSVSISSAGSVLTMRSGRRFFERSALTASPGSSMRSVWDWFSSLAMESRRVCAAGGTAAARRQGPVTAGAEAQRSPIGV